MYNKIDANYNSIREAINKNIETIKLLFEQAKNLHSIVENLEQKESKEKEEMERIIESLMENITVLVEQTNQLFKIYQDFIKTL